MLNRNGYITVLKEKHPLVAFFETAYHFNGTSLQVCVTKYHPFFKVHFSSAKFKFWVDSYMQSRTTLTFFLYNFATSFELTSKCRRTRGTPGTIKIIPKKFHLEIENLYNMKCWTTGKKASYKKLFFCVDGTESECERELLCEHKFFFLRSCW